MTEALGYCARCGVPRRLLPLNGARRGPLHKYLFPLNGALGGPLVCSSCASSRCAEQRATREHLNPKARAAALASRREAIMAEFRADMRRLHPDAGGTGDGAAIAAVVERRDRALRQLNSLAARTVN